MAKLSKLKQDTDALAGGRWFPWTADVELLIRPLDCEAYQTRLRELQKPHERLMRAAPDSDMAREASRKAVRRAVAECILIGWKNLEGDDGPIEYSADVAEDLFSDPALQHLYRMVVNTAADETAFLAADEADDSGN